VSARPAEDRPGLHTNVFGVLRPLMPPTGDGIERLFLTKVRPGGGYLGDGKSHRGVVGPLAWLPAEGPTAHHGDFQLRAAWRAELIGGTQGVSGCGAQQDAAGPVKLCGSQRYRSNLPSPTESGHELMRWPPKGAKRSTGPRRGLRSVVRAPVGGLRSFVGEIPIKGGAADAEGPCDHAVSSSAK